MLTQEEGKKGEKGIKGEFACSKDTGPEISEAGIHIEKNICCLSNY